MGNHDSVYYFAILATTHNPSGEEHALFSCNGIIAFFHLTWRKERKETMGGRIETRKGHRYFLKGAIVKGCFFGEFLFIENIDVPFMIGEQKIPETGSRISFDFVIRGREAVITSLRTFATA